MTRRALGACIVFMALLASCSVSSLTGVDASLVTFSGGELRPTAGTIVVSARGRKVATKHSADGSFSLDLKAGTYTLDGTTAKGVKCIQNSVTVTRHTRSSLTLECL